MTFTAAARAAVLSRLWGALAREPIPGIAGREHDGSTLVVRLADGRALTGPADAAEPFADAPAGLRIGGHDDPVALITDLVPGPAGARLAAELADSVTNLARSRAAAPEPDRGTPYLTRSPDLADLEQCVVDGHPLHPLCRTRTGMSEAEVRAYAPEHRPVVHLREYAVPAGAWLSTGRGLPPRLLVHPWQHEHVLPRYPWLSATGRTVAARPLMSLRTLAPLDHPTAHVKTAVDVQMTSAVRIVSPAAVRNGPVVSALVGELGTAAGLDVLRETAAGAVLIDGQPSRHLAMVLRQAPATGPGEVVMPLAALCAPSPATGRALLTEAVDLGYGGDPHPFAAELVHLLLPPLLRLLHSGVALEAHGQNTLVMLRTGQPARLYYRDLGGVRLSPARLAAAGITTAPPHGDLATDDPDELRTKLFAAVLSTVVGQLAATLRREYGTDPDTIWKLVAGTARDTYADLPRTARPDARALFAADLPVKAMTAMRLADDPIHDLWTTVPNPLAGR
ncbi:IucA/IucC family protein [Rugosimonospora africana]|uniref:Iron transporter n=1 Tax=Rugosimonospora africana TaxID=556532 RepID=A0A8J3R2C4_9ACTN|nr:IucA/IucC family protein [Rugosimonospora africana]GIH20090.1 iron transporter [Rugosimonospora africana]